MCFGTEFADQRGLSTAVQRGPAFDSTKSSTFSQVSSPAQQITYAYGDSTQFTADIVQDTIILGGFVSDNAAWAMGVNVPVNFEESFYNKDTPQLGCSLFGIDQGLQSRNTELYRQNFRSNFLFNVFQFCSIPPEIACLQLQLRWRLPLHKGLVIRVQSFILPSFCRPDQLMSITYQDLRQKIPSFSRR